MWVQNWHEMYVIFFTNFQSLPSQDMGYETDIIEI